MNRTDRRALQKAQHAYVAQMPERLTPVPREQWTPIKKMPIAVWRSRKYLVQAYQEGQDIIRLTVARARHNGTSWEDNITWDELQLIKSEVGFGDKDAVEVYPPDTDIVRVSNMRHLWVFDKPIQGIVWRRNPAEGGINLGQQ